MMTALNASETLRTRGVRQGSLIELAAESALAGLLNSFENRIIIASQDCDVVALSDRESSVDILPARLQDQDAPDLRYGRNPRELALELSDGRFAIVDIRQRQTVLKTQLVEAFGDTSPGSCLASSERRMFARWLGRRYTRDAFPDTFNNRLQAKRSAFEKLVKSASSQHVTNVLFLLSPSDDELKNDEEYEVALWCTCSDQSYADDSIRKTAEDFTKKYAALLAECPGIFVLEACLKPHSEVTLEDLEYMRRFEYDHRSLAKKPGGELSSVE